MKETINKDELEEGLGNIRQALLVGDFPSKARRKMQLVKTHIRTLLNVHSVDGAPIKSNQIKSIRATISRCEKEIKEVRSSLQIKLIFILRGYFMANQMALLQERADLLFERSKSPLKDGQDKFQKRIDEINAELGS